MTEKHNNITNYSKILSSLFCSTSIASLTILCLLNNRALDLYSAVCLLKIVVPASFCFWFLGRVIGTILEKVSATTPVVSDKIDVSNNAAYQIPSIFTDESALMNNKEDSGIL